MKQAVPSQYIFSRRLRIPQFIRALLVIGVGALLLVFSANLQSMVDNPWKRIALFMSAFILISGILGLLFVSVATFFHKQQIIEVTQDGLKVSRPDKNGKPYSQSLRWDNVTSYSKEAGGISGLWNWTPTPHSRVDGDDLFGCFVGIVVNFYIILLEFFITGFSWRVTFKQSGRRVMSISGFGKPMDDLVDHVLPYFLANKEARPSDQTEERQSAE